MKLGEGGICLEEGGCERHGMHGRLQAGVARSRIRCSEASRLVTWGGPGRLEGAVIVQHRRAATISSGPTGCRALAQWTR